MVFEGCGLRGAVVLLDFEIGYGSNADPAGITLDAIAQARAVRAPMPGKVAFVGYVQGMEGDEQGLEDQRKKLQDAGACCCPRCHGHRFGLGFQFR